MITLLSRIFIKEKHCATASSLCHSYALLCGIVGIVLNILLFTNKIAIGIISHSVAISADAFNNLADAGSCAIAIFGFWIASFGAGKEHPFGHGRMEWLIGLFTSLSVIVIGFEFAKSSIISFLHPQKTEYTFLSIAVLSISIIVKLYMFSYNRSIGRKIASSSMKATAIDCISDCAATGAVLVSALISWLSGIETDGWCGLLVSLFIIFAGYCSIKDVMERIMGIAPNQDFLEKVNEIIGQYKFVHSVYDLTVHDYGFGRFVVSMRIEGDYSNSEILHITADDISYTLYTELGCKCTIQVDYLYTDWKEKESILFEINQLVQKVNAEILIQNFHITQAGKNVNLIFDLVMPSAFQDIGEQLKKEIIQLYSDYRVICNIQILHNHPMPKWI